MGNLVKMRSPEGEVVEVARKNATDLKQHHGFVHVGSDIEEADKAQTALARAPRSVKNRDEETAARLNAAKAVAVEEPEPVTKPKAEPKAKSKASAKDKVEKKAVVEPDIDASAFDDGFDDLEAEEETRGNRGSVEE